MCIRDSTLTLGDGGASNTTAAPRVLSLSAAGRAPVRLRRLAAIADATAAAAAAVCRPAVASCYAASRRPVAAHRCCTAVAQWLRRNAEEARADNLMIPRFGS
eukprot:11990728-Alexandrium_andersonii.AAC.1